MLDRVTEARSYRELTPTAVIGGVLVGVLLNMGIVYAGLMIFGLVGCIDCDWDPDAKGVEKLDLDALEADDDGGAGGEDEL